MGKRGAARREKRIAKREIAKEERGGQKYKNQKGGVGKQERKRGKRGSKGRSNADGDEVRSHRTLADASARRLV